jgi:hypothetical protein
MEVWAEAWADAAEVEGVGTPAYEEEDESDVDGGGGGGGLSGSFARLGYVDESEEDGLASRALPLLLLSLPSLSSEKWQRMDLTKTA